MNVNGGSCKSCIEVLAKLV